MAEVRFGAPLDVHIPFHKSAAPERALFGAMGSGKTYALCDEAIAVALEQPGSRLVISRWTIPALRDTTEAVFAERIPPELWAAGEVRRSGGHVERFIFPNGSIVLFRPLDDWKKQRSQNVAFWFVDEADEIDEETWDGLSTRVRQRDPTAEARRLGYTGEITRRGMALACNPAGHNWIYHRFIDPEKRKDGCEFFRSTSFDNPYLAVDTLERYLTLPEEWVKRYVLCQFDDFGGQVYEKWSYDGHVIKPYLVPKEGLIWMGMDPGTRNPTAGLWVHVDRSPGHPPRLVGIAEYEEAGLPVDEHVKAWRQIERGFPAVRWRVADPNINTRDRGTTMSLHAQYARHHYNFQLGPRTHKDRIPMLGNLIASKQFVVTENCPCTYEAIKQYRWEDLSTAARKKGEDAPERPVKANDHLVDCAQYVSSRWAGPIQKPIEPDEELTAAELFSRDVRATIRQNIVRNRVSSQCDLGPV